MTTPLRHNGQLGWLHVVPCQYGYRVEWRCNGKRQVVIVSQQEYYARKLAAA